MEKEVNCPCKGCLDRKLGCHGFCRAFEDWKIEETARKEWLAEQNGVINTEPRWKRNTLWLRRRARGEIRGKHK